MERLYFCGSQLRTWLVAHEHNFIAGIIMAITSYFAPVKNIMIVVFAALALDFLTGVIASMKNGKGFKSRRAWRSVYKLAFILAIIALMFAIDKEIPVIKLHIVFAWIIVGFEVWSILENMAKIVDHPVFRVLKKFMEDKVKENTGVNLNEQNEQNN